MSNMSTEARELEITITNDGELHRRYEAPFQANQLRRWKKGTWDQEQAAQGYKYFVIAGAKKYIKDFCGTNTRVQDIFPKAVLDEVCASLAEAARKELECGAWG